MLLFPMSPELHGVLLAVFALAQLLFLLSLLANIYLYVLPTDFVRADEIAAFDLAGAPQVLLLYPVLNEAENTMRTTLLSVEALDYPAGKRRVVAVFNAFDAPTRDNLVRLQAEFPFLEMLETPRTSDPAWAPVWRAWDDNPHAYWWHSGPRARMRDLPPKKTRQLIFALYTLVGASTPHDLLVNYIDADSCLPVDHFRGGAAGIARFDVLQAQNVAGNLNASIAASWHALDHMTWDGDKYAHLSAHGRQPYWVLGKGLFVRARDLVQLGGFHPWIAIEDPELGMRFWASGKRLGILRAPLLEETPETFREGFKQRRRWVCGFFQSLDPAVLDALGLTPWEQAKAWMIFAPCLSLWVNALGAPTGLWALWVFLTGREVFAPWLVVLSVVNLLGLCAAFANMYVKTWRRTRLVLDRLPDRIAYMIRINPVFVMIWWVIWLAPLAAGLWMYLTDGGLVWKRTEKIDANHNLVRSLLGARAESSLASQTQGRVTEGETE